MERAFMHISRKLRLPLTAICIVLLLLLYWGSGRWSSGSASGGPILALKNAGNSSDPPTALRLATFNIHSGIGQDDKVNLDRTAGVLKGCDVIALQEVAGDRPWQTNFAVQIGAALGIASHFFPTETHWWYPVFGNAILTRYDVDSWARTPLPRGYHMANRNYVHLTLPFGAGKLNLLIVHLGKKSDRARQFETVTAVFKSLPTPAVMMGDLNTRPYDKMMQALLKGGDVRDVIGEQTPPNDRVDFILTRGVSCTKAGLITTDASDHPLAWADIEAIK